MNEKLFALQIEAIIKRVQVIERFGAHLAMLEACETIAGVMSEQSELISIAEKSNATEFQEFLSKVAQGRIYSAHFDAIRDAMRLCKLLTELIEETNEFIEGGGEAIFKNI